MATRAAARKQKSDSLNQRVIIPSGLLRPEVSQALEVLGAQMHFVV
jgi:hypothetical protein